MNRFVILNINDESLIWSNTDGWIDTDQEGYDTFTIEETETLNLPIEGKWVRLSVLV